MNAKTKKTANVATVEPTANEPLANVATVEPTANEPAPTANEPAPYVFPKVTWETTVEDSQPIVNWLPASALWARIGADGAFSQVDNIGRKPMSPEQIGELAGLLANGWRITMGVVYAVAEQGATLYAPEVSLPGSEDANGDVKPFKTTANRYRNPAAQLRVIDCQRRVVSLAYACLLAGIDILVPVVVVASAGNALERVRANSQSGKQDYDIAGLAVAAIELADERAKVAGETGRKEIAKAFGWGVAISERTGKPVEYRNGDRTHLAAVVTLHQRYPSFGLAEKLRKRETKLPTREETVTLAVGSDVGKLPSPFLVQWMKAIGATLDTYRNWRAGNAKPTLAEFATGWALALPSDGAKTFASGSVTAKELATGRAVGSASEALANAIGKGDRAATVEQLANVDRNARTYEALQRVIGMAADCHHPMLAALKALQSGDPLPMQTLIQADKA